MRTRSGKNRMELNMRVIRPKKAEEVKKKNVTNNEKVFLLLDK